MLLALLSLAHAGRTPCWLTAPCPPYEEAAYVVGVGSGATPGAAEDAARAAIAKVFSVRISRTEESLVQASRAAGGVDQRSTLSVTTRSETERQLEGVRITERFVAKKDGTCWALAVLERAPAIATLRDQIAATEAALAERPGSAVDRVRQLGRAIPAAEALAYQVEELAVLEGGAASPSVRWEALVQRHQAAWEALGVAVDGGAWQEPVVAAITAQGLSVRAERADLRVAVGVTEQVAKPDGSGFVKVTLRGSLSVLEGDTRLAEAPVEAEAASRSIDKARELARAALATELAAAGPLVAGVLR
jgi:hypothetical protein